MVYNNRVKPISDSTINSDVTHNVASLVSLPRGQGSSISSSKEVTDLDSISTVGLEESSYLKLRPFSKLDPTLVRLLTFLNCFGLTVNFVSSKEGGRRAKQEGSADRYSKFFKILLMLVIVVLSGEVVYDVNVRQSKLLAEQKRSTPLLTFVIVAYSWLTLVTPIICDVSLLIIGSPVFRFYSRTTTTVCNGMFFGKRTSVDSWWYYLLLVLIAFLDAMGQLVVLGVWPKSIDHYFRMMLSQEGSSGTSFILGSGNDSSPSWAPTSSPPAHQSGSMELLVSAESRESSFHYETGTQLPQQANFRVNAYLLDSLLGERYAHSDLGICIKILCLMIQFVHSYAFFFIIISLANHYASAIGNINENLEKYEFRRLLKQLIILRDSSEQISLMMSIPFALIINLVFMRQIALNGVFIQSTMLPYENMAVSLQSFTCSVSIFMVFIYCDGLQTASKQTHRLKTEQTVVNENRDGNQSRYEFLDYLDRLSKSIRITFFNIIAINKGSLVGLYGHILTLTFVTS